MPDPSPTVFLDRDGTLNREKHYLSDPNDLELLPHIEKLSKLSDAGFQLIVVTNQSPIGRGIFTEQRLLEIHQRLDEMLKEQGVTIDGWYYCPHTPDNQCACRKPGTGMFQQADLEHGCDFSASWMIGDKVIDCHAGKAAGTRSILLETGYGKKEYDRPEREKWVDFYLPGLAETVETIYKHSHVA